MILTSRSRASVLALLAMLFALVISPPVSAETSPYPLEVLNIKPAGTGTPPIPPGNRIFRAYPGVEYNIRAAVIGGTYPYTFAISGAPSGMTINERTGEISWMNPQSSSDNIRLTVTDSSGNSVETSWTVNVTTEGFVFVDPSYDGSSTGSIGQPFKSIVDMLEAVGTTQNNNDAIVYLRGGDHELRHYGPSDRSTLVSINVWAPWHGPTTWVGYPGETVNIDTRGFGIRAHQVWLDNLHFFNCLDYGVVFWGGSHYSAIRRTTWNDISTRSSVNDNQGYIHTTSAPGDRGYGIVIQDNRFANFTGAQAMGSLYDTHKLLLENNHTSGGGFSGNHRFATPIGLKTRNTSSTIRGNRIVMPRNAVQFEMFNQYGGADSAYLDFSYNLVQRESGGATNNAMLWYYPNHVFAYRNTFVGDLEFLPELSPGPFSFSKNVLIGRLINATHVTEHDNVIAQRSDNVVDSSGYLTGDYEAFLGVYGFQVDTSNARPRAPEMLGVE